MKERADEGSNEMMAQKQQLLFSEIERLMKKFKTHRCALDFDRGFVSLYDSSLHSCSKRADRAASR